MSVRTKSSRLLNILTVFSAYSIKIDICFEYDTIVENSFKKMPEIVASAKQSFWTDQYEFLWRSFDRWEHMFANFACKNVFHGQAKILRLKNILKLLY